MKSPEVRKGEIRDEEKDEKIAVQIEEEENGDGKERKGRVKRRERCRIPSALDSGLCGESGGCPCFWMRPFPICRAVSCVCRVWVAAVLTGFLN